MDFSIPRFLLLELAQRLDRFVTGQERAPGTLAAWVEMNFDEEDEFADLLDALESGDEKRQIAACRSAAARVNDVLRADWMEE